MRSTHLDAAPSRTQRLLLMAQTMTLEEMGRREGISRERVRQLLSAVGFRRRDVTRPCIGCGGPARGTYCLAEACRKAYQRAYYQKVRPRSRAPRAVCAHCQTTLKRPVRLDGKPSYCADKRPCRSAAHLWRYHNVAAHRAYVERYRRSERGREVDRRAKARYLASKHGAERLAKGAERAVERRQLDAAAQARAAARQQQREALASARAAAQARRAAAEAAAAARVREAVRLSQAQRLSERGIAARLGVSRSTVSAWLHGQRRASALTSATR